MIASGRVPKHSMIFFIFSHLILPVPRQAGADPSGVRPLLSVRPQNISNVSLYQRFSGKAMLFRRCRRGLRYAVCRRGAAIYPQKGAAIPKKEHTAEFLISAVCSLFSLVARTIGAQLCQNHIFVSFLRFPVFPALSFRFSFQKGSMSFSFLPVRSPGTLLSPCISLYEVREKRANEKRKFFSIFSAPAFPRLLPHGILPRTPRKTFPDSLI